GNDVAWNRIAHGVAVGIDECAEGIEDRYQISVAESGVREVAGKLLRRGDAAYGRCRGEALDAGIVAEEEGLVSSTIELGDVDRGGDRAAEVVSGGID